ncbi:hypothetical protein [Pseudodesulfovibrio sediminis]|uniref:Uncharacterized protein n=1 Tax=Pseudodesulfovibrio sediminis TaxID=2810563 RepID=A0ABM7P872_9BACT|nr:hypothetical protein [Pseudodesulfovibrio sediminis]BCS89106.1 hypothetical protein PSDVSF_23480 [Pseudodesulfovibrio sediminis]
MPKRSNKLITIISDTKEHHHFVIKTSVHVFQTRQNAPESGFPFLPEHRIENRPHRIQADEKALSPGFDTTSFGRLRLRCVFLKIWKTRTTRRNETSRPNGLLSETELAAVLP